MARSDAEQEIRRRIAPILKPDLQPALDALLDVSEDAAAAPIKTLGHETRTVRQIGESIEKLQRLRRHGDLRRSTLLGSVETPT